MRRLLQVKLVGWTIEKDWELDAAELPTINQKHNLKIWEWCNAAILERKC
jgi:hypothetical protein